MVNVGTDAGRVHHHVLVLVGQEEVAHVAVLHLGEGLGAVEGLRAAVAGGAALVPALAPVAVGVHADAVEAGVHRPDIRWGEMGNVSTNRACEFEYFPTW